MACGVIVAVAAVVAIVSSVLVPPCVRVWLPLAVAFSLCLFLVYVLAVEEAGSACTYLPLVYICLSVVYAVHLPHVLFSVALSTEFALANSFGSL